MKQKLILLVILSYCSLAHSNNRHAWVFYGGWSNPYLVVKQRSEMVNNNGLVGTGGNIQLFEKLTLELTGLFFVPPYKVERLAIGLKSTYITGLLEGMLKSRWSIPASKFNGYGKAGIWWSRTKGKHEKLKNENVVPPSVEPMNSYGIGIGGGIDYPLWSKWFIDISGTYCIPSYFREKNYIKNAFPLIKLGVIRYF